MFCFSIIAEISHICTSFCTKHFGIYCKIYTVSTRIHCFNMLIFIYNIITKT